MAIAVSSHSFGREGERGGRHFTWRGVVSLPLISAMSFKGITQVDPLVRWNPLGFAAPSSMRLKRPPRIKDGASRRCSLGRRGRNVSSERDLMVMKTTASSSPAATQGRGSALRHASFPALSMVSTRLFLNLHSPALSSRVALLRPLIMISRSDVTRLCLCWGLPIYPDPTNMEISSARNRIRRDLLPALRVVFNPDIDNTLSRSSGVLSTEQMYIERIVSRLNRAITLTRPMPRARSYDIPIPIKRAMARHWLQDEASYHQSGIRFSSIEGVLQQVSQDSIHSFPIVDG